MRDRELQERRSSTNILCPIALLMTLPGVGFTLGVVIALEVGDVTRFASHEKFAAYAETTPRVRARGQDVVRPAAVGRQPLPQVGVRASGQRDLSPAPPPPASYEI